MLAILLYQKLKEMAYELRQDSIFSDNGLSTKIRVSKVFRPIQLQLLYACHCFHGQNS